MKGVEPWFLSWGGEQLPVLHPGPPSVEFMPGFSCCLDCRTSLPKSRRCTPAARDLTQLSVYELRSGSVPACPLDIQDELSRRARHGKGTGRWEYVPDDEKNESPRRFRLWRRKRERKEASA